MPLSNLLCLAVDRLHAGMIGAYGNTWIRTPQFDHLACQSFVFDQAAIHSPTLEGFYRGCWLGHRAATVTPAGGMSLIQLANQAGLHTALLTDEPRVNELPWTVDFGERVVIETPDVPEAATDIAETQLARLFGAVIDWLESPPQPFLLWVHARGMGGPWDGPLELRNQYAEEDDPLPPEFVAVPELTLNENYDADELLGYVHAYAGQIAMLDTCLGALVDHLDDGGLAANTQLTVLSARGFSLGEHRHVGASENLLFGETVQIPWLMRFPDGLGSLCRAPALVQPADLPGTLLDWLGLDRTSLAASGASGLMEVIRGQRDALRDRILITSDSERAIRTPAWYLRVPGAGTLNLFAKPSDRWEVNEVSNLLPEVTAGLQAALEELTHASPSVELAPLADLLVAEVD